MSKQQEPKNQLALFEDQLAKLAAQESMAERAAAGQVFLSSRGGVLTYRDQPIAGNQLDVVILASPVERLYYTKRFDPQEPAPPVCFALGPSMTGLKPSPASTEAQAPMCQNCPKDQWGTAMNGGKGKACSEKRRLLIMTADSASKPEAVAMAEVAALRIPVTSVKPFATYVQTIAAATKRPLAAVVTKLSLVPDSKTQFKLKFDFVRAIEDMDLVQSLIKRGEAELANAIASNNAGQIEEHEEAAAVTAEKSSKF